MTEDKQTSVDLQIFSVHFNQTGNSRTLLDNLSCSSYLHKSKMYDKWKGTAKYRVGTKLGTVPHTVMPPISRNRKGLSHCLQLVQYFQLVLFPMQINGWKQLILRLQRTISIRFMKQIRKYIVHLVVVSSHVVQKDLQDESQSQYFNQEINNILKITITTTTIMIMIGTLLMCRSHQRTTYMYTSWGHLAKIAYLIIN